MELLRTDLKQRYQKYYLDASITPPKKVQIHTVTRRRLFHFSKQKKGKIFLSKRKSRNEVAGLVSVHSLFAISHS